MFRHSTQTLGFVTVCCSMSIVSKTSYSHKFSLRSRKLLRYTHAWTKLHTEVMSWTSGTYKCHYAWPLPETNSSTVRDLTIHSVRHALCSATWLVLVVILVNTQSSLHCKQGSLWQTSFYNFMWYMEQNLQLPVNNYVEDNTHLLLYIEIRSKYHHNHSHMNFSTRSLWTATARRSI